ncbi:MAG TPA: fused MFS/spermidine synthase, partial [Bryobacteraceae bacterium]|nr:fused MFS/spermidine synthase [Bryobacteraceae bacterium]
MIEQDIGRDSAQVALNRFLPALLLLFVGSGCAALTYEIVWYQLLELVIGSSAVSLGVLLGTFMGGLCLGSLLLPRLVPPNWHPLRVYGVLELGIAVCGVLVLYAIPYAGRVYAAALGHGLPGLLLRGLVCAICLLVPTMLMGATLPAIARWVETTPRGVSWLGFFYGGNTAGAVLGCLLAGFYLLRVHDMVVATWSAMAINVAVALLSLALSRSAPRSAPSVAPEPDMRRVPGGSWTIYLAIALSGLTALGAEVIWARQLSLMLGATVYTFSIILAVFLLGIGLGSGVGSLWARDLQHPRVALGLCQLGLAGAIAWTAFMIARSLPYWPINPSLTSNPWTIFQIDLVRCLWTALPPALLWGASFPLALASVAARGQDPGRLVGRVYASNTVGAILGALLFSVLFIPRLGTQGSQRVLIATVA